MVIKMIITSEGGTDEEQEDYLLELRSFADSTYSFDSQIVKNCEQCDNGIFYFTKDNKLADAQKCGKCKGSGVLPI